MKNKYKAFAERIVLLLRSLPLSRDFKIYGFARLENEGTYVLFRLYFWCRIDASWGLKLNLTAVLFSREPWIFYHVEHSDTCVFGQRPGRSLFSIQRLTSGDIQI
jgi:hypothetical protein